MGRGWVEWSACFFFFQAEDGIRDRDVTGVQTCALPIYYSVTVGGVATAKEGGVTRFYRYAFAGNTSVPSGQAVLSYDLVTSRTLDNTTVARSEERRVGKERRSRWLPCSEKREGGWEMDD